MAYLKRKHFGNKTIGTSLIETVLDDGQGNLDYNTTRKCVYSKQGGGSFTTGRIITTSQRVAFSQPKLTGLNYVHQAQPNKHSGKDFTAGRKKTNNDQTSIPQ